MSNTKGFKAPSKKQVEFVPGKYDGFKLVKKGEYRHQKGSARSACLELAKDGMLVGTWVKKCCEIGYEPRFPTNCIQKLMTTKEPAWVFSDKNDQGLTVAEVTGSRSLEKAKEKVAKKAAKAEKKPKAKSSKPKRPKGVDSNNRIIENAAE